MQRNMKYEEAGRVWQRNSSELLVYSTGKHIYRYRHMYNDIIAMFFVIILTQCADISCTLQAMAVLLVDGSGNSKQ
jgi:hypothetical protein